MDVIMPYLQTKTGMVLLGAGDVSRQGDPDAAQLGGITWHPLTAPASPTPRKPLPAGRPRKRAETFQQDREEQVWVCILGWGESWPASADQRTPRSPFAVLPNSPPQIRRLNLAASGAAGGGCELRDPALARAGPGAQTKEGQAVSPLLLALFV